MRDGRAGTGAVPGDAGFEAVPGSAELRSSPLLGASVLLAAADDGIGPGSAGCAELQPDTTARAAAAAHRIRRAARRRWRGDRTLPFVIVAGWVLAALCHRDTAGRGGESASVVTGCRMARGRRGDDDLAMTNRRNHALWSAVVALLVVVLAGCSGTAIPCPDRRAEYRWAPVWDAHTGQ